MEEEEERRGYGRIYRIGMVTMAVRDREGAECARV